MRIAIVGAGPAGAWTSTLLARRGHAVTLIDSQAPWEKPCGGGVTTKVLSNFAIFDSELPRKYIDRITIYFSDQRSVTVPTEQPLAVLSRQEFGKYLMTEAEKAGGRDRRIGRSDERFLTPSCRHQGPTSRRFSGTARYLLTSFTRGILRSSRCT